MPLAVYQVLPVDPDAALTLSLLLLVISATVIAPKMLMAESAAKVVLILGSRDGLKWLESQADLAALLVLENGEIIRSSRMDGYIWK